MLRANRAMRDRASDMATSGQNQHIQALRAVAALLVVVGHSAHETAVLSDLTGRDAVPLAFANWGFGVDVFFVISGFIMVYTSADLFGRPGAPRIFLMRRIARIVPLYWLLTTALLIGALIAPRLLNVPIDGWGHVLASYLFIPSLRAPGEIRPVMALGWTLNLEMFFYALFALALLLPFRAGMTALAVVMTALALFGMIARPEQVQIAFWTQSIILEFLFGCLLAVAHLRGARLKGPAALGLALLGLAGIARIPALEGVMPDALRWGVPALMLVAAAALHQGEAGRVTLWLAVLGNASYSLYLVHPFALRPLRNIWARLVGDALPLGAYIVTATVLATLVSLLVYRLMERPLLRRLRGPGSPHAPREPVLPHGSSIRS